MWALYIRGSDLDMVMGGNRGGWGCVAPGVEEVYSLAGRRCIVSGEGLLRRGIEDADVLHVEALWSMCCTLVLGPGQGRG